MYKDFGLNINLDKCVDIKISWKTGDMKKIKCNKGSVNL
jgi:hypothetical protein